MHFKEHGIIYMCVKSLPIVADTNYSELEFVGSKHVANSNVANLRGSETSFCQK